MDVWDEFLDILEASEVHVFGITDYFCCKNYFTAIEKYNARFPNGKKKVFFPNIEFRLSEAIGADGKSPDLHILFDNDLTCCSREHIENFLRKLETHETTSTGSSKFCSDLKTTKDFESATVSLKAVKSALKSVFGDTEPYMLVFPAKNDGMKTVDTGVPRKISIATEIDKTCHAFFGDSACTDHFLRQDRYVGEPSQKKPVYSGSDAHSLEDLERLSGLVTGFEPTWIKAEPTFRGLMQTIFEPSARVHIGERPDVQRRMAHEATKFISSLKVDQISSYDERNGRWFKKIDIPINPELTAIIGNKGSGKSALADIMGLLGDSRQDSHFSFLTDSSRNKKFRQRGYAENFAAELTWASGQIDTKNLADSTDKEKAERVKYLPQNFFETLTNEIEVKQFQAEIEEVVFSHVEETDRLKTKSFKELEELKTKESRDQVSALKVKLREVNHSIDALSRQSKPEFKISLQKALVAKQEELAALQAAMPVEVSEPAEESPEQKAVSAEIEKTSAILATLEANERTCLEEISSKKARLEKAKALNTAMSALAGHISTQVQANEAVTKELGLSMDQILQYKINIETIAALEARLKSEIENLTVGSEKPIEGTDLTVLGNLPDIRRAKAIPSARLQALREQLSAPHKRYQMYRQSKLEIEQKMLLVRGDAAAPQADTIAFFEGELRRLETDLASNIAAAKEARRKIAKEIFDSKKLVLEFYKELKASVEGRLVLISEEEFKVSIEASFVQAPNFLEDFFDIVSKAVSGPFYRSGEDVLQTKLALVNWGDFDEIHAFAEKIVAEMEASDIDKQIRQSKVAKQLHDFLFEMEYIDTKYELRLGDKNLNQLSPGEKGLLLLVFYLYLDKENIPLIIDQAEDNLDNDSIFKVLARCIREAKKNRQVILVTHNPNLAVGADAEQIIYVKLEKHKKYQFSYESGAIEEPKTNANIVKVLEGSRPAFVQRRLKYHIS